MCTEGRQHGIINESMVSFVSRRYMRGITEFNSVKPDSYKYTTQESGNVGLRSALLIRIGKQNVEILHK